MGIPYTYRITHLPSGKHYYGARYAKSCHPNDLWVKYFTSSKVVKKLIEQDGTDAFFVEVRKVFSDAESCIDWERKVLTRLKVTTNQNWLNLVVSRLPSDTEMKALFIEKYGTDKPQWLPKIAEKRKKTSLAKYGTERPQSSEEVKNKTKNTNMERYGVGSTLSLKDVQEKIKQTRRERYNADHHFANDDIKKKIVATNLERHGVDNVLRDPAFRAKATKTIMEKYGVSHVMRDPEIAERARTSFVGKYGKGSDGYDELRQRTEATTIERYGIAYYAMTDEFKERFTQTSMEKYGYDNPAKHPDIRKKISDFKQNQEPIVCEVCGLECRDPSPYHQFHGTKCKWKPIECIDTGQVFLKRTELMKFVGARSPKANYQAIRNVCDGKYQKAYGYHWRYATESDLDQSTNKGV